MVKYPFKVLIIILLSVFISLSSPYYVGRRINYMDNVVSDQNEVRYSGSLGCYLCSQLMTITQSKMELNQVQLKTVLNERCNNLSTLIKAQCFTFVTESLPQIYYSLTYDMSHKNICEMLNICEVNKLHQFENISNVKRNHENRIIVDNIHSSVVKPIPLIKESGDNNDMSGEEQEIVNLQSKKSLVPITFKPKITTTPSTPEIDETTVINVSSNPTVNYIIQEKFVYRKSTERPLQKSKKPKTIVYVPSDIKSDAKIPEFEDLTNPVKLDVKGMRMTCLFCEKMLNNAKNYAISAKTEISHFANNTCAKLTKSAMSEQCYKLTDRKISELANFVDEQVVEALWCAQMNNC
uniref:Saposin B-type domain-containing protein n=1 Tax=Parastrongyloides trichosuri TaxID=131310 RepID=A0A0N4Z320_PARTI